MPFARPRRLLAAGAALTLLTGASVAADPALPTPAQAAPKPAAPQEPEAELTAAVAKAKSSGKPVELPSETTPVSQTLADPDGTLTTTLSPRPVRAKHGAQWVQLVAKLRRNADGTYSPTASSTGLRLSGKPSTLLATMVNGTEQLTMNWPKTLPEPTVEEATATYANVLPDVDLKVTVTEQGGFAHVLIVKNATAATNPELKSLAITTSTTKGLALTAKASGELVATDTFQRTLFSADAPVMWDSTTTAPPAAAGLRAQAAGEDSPVNIRSTPEGPGADAKMAKVGVHLSGGTLTLTPDQKLLTDKATTYPVYIDPSWNPTLTAAGRSAWAYITSATADTNHLNGRNFSARGWDLGRAGYQGWEWPYYTARSYFQFGVPGSIHGARIDSATMNVTQVWSANREHTDLDLKHTCRIDGNTTWNRRPCEHGHVSSVWAEPAHGEGKEKIIGFDVRGLVQQAADGRWGEVTVGLFNRDESNLNRWRKFKNDPSITIKYNLPPNTPGRFFTSPATPCSNGLIGNTSVTFTAQLSDPDGSQGHLEAGFAIRDETTGQMLAEPRVTVSSNEYASVHLDKNRFTDGHTYAWNVWADDGRDRSATTPTCRFTVNHKQPAEPAVASTTYPAKVVGPAARTPGTFTFTPPPGTDRPVSFVYSLNTPPPHTIPQSFGTFRGGTLVAAAANGAPTTVTITPNRIGPNVLYVYAINEAGNPGAVAAYAFGTGRLAKPDTAGDVTGDGIPDVMLVGAHHRPGLWLHRGTDRPGHVNSATQVGASGLAHDGSTSTAQDWIGATITVSEFDDDGVQDVLVRTAKASPTEGNLQVIAGVGDGHQFGPATASPIRLPRIDHGGDYQTADQVAASITGSVFGEALPDLYVVVGDTLYLYTPSSLPGRFNLHGALSNGWSGKTITATRVGGNPALFARNDASGELTLWVGDNARGVAAGAVDNVDPAKSSKTLVYGSGGFDAKRVHSMSGADVNLDGKPDLWAATNEGTLAAYISTGNTAFGEPVRNKLGNTGFLRSGVANKCLDNVWGGIDDGNVVMIHHCNGGDLAQLWQLPGDGTVRVAGKCLDVRGGQSGNGTKVQLYTCAETPAQQWLLQPDKTLKNPLSGRCLDVPSGQPDSWVQVQIYDCNASAAQQWTFDSAGYGKIVASVPNRCVDVENGKSTPGTPIQIYECVDVTAQQWTIVGDGTIRAFANCMTASGGFWNGVSIQLRECTNDPYQEWQIGPNNSLINPASGRCLANPGNSTANSTRLILWDCIKDDPAQRWLLPPL